MKEEQTIIQAPEINPRSGRTGEERTSTEGKFIKVGRHGAERLMTSDPQKDEKMLRGVALPQGVPEPQTLEERLKLVKRLIAQSMGVQDIESGVPDRLGFNITNQAERDVLFGVLKLMTDSDYRGEFQVPTTQVLRQKFEENTRPVEAQTKGFEVLSTHIGGAYENIESVPFVRITQKSLIEAIGYDPESQSDKARVGGAVRDLAMKQNFLMWTRFKRDDKGKVVRDKNGRTRFEIVSTFSPVLNVNFVSEQEEGRGLVLKYYEISLSPILLDQVSREYGGVGGGYFLLIPENYNSEIQEAYRKRFPYRSRVSPIVQALCFWLRLIVQERQNQVRNPLRLWKQTRGKKQPPRKISSELRVGYADLCRRLNVSESSIRKQKSRISQNIEDGISIARDIGYITTASNDILSGEYIFDLNLNYYPSRYAQGESPEEGPEA